MGIRDTLKKLAQGSDHHDSDAATQENSTPEQFPELSPGSSSSPQPEIPTISVLPTITGKRKPSNAAWSGSTITTTRPRQTSDVTGKRKPQDTAALVASRPRASTHQPPTRKGEGEEEEEGEPSPSDYLYFGPKKEEEAPKSNAGSSASTGQATTRTRPYHQPSSSSGGHDVQTSRTDDSGFLNTGVAGARQQMGYQNLTYGGSLQYDYAGTQAPY